MKPRTKFVTANDLENVILRTVAYLTQLDISLDELSLFIVPYPWQRNNSLPYPQSIRTYQISYSGITDISIKAPISWDLRPLPCAGPALPHTDSRVPCVFGTTRPHSQTFTSLALVISWLVTWLVSVMVKHCPDPQSSRVSGVPRTGLWR